MDSDEDYVFSARTAAAMAKTHGRQLIFQCIKDKATRGKTKMLVRISSSTRIETVEIQNREVERLYMPHSELDFLKRKGYQVSEYDPYGDEDDYYYVSWANLDS